MSNHPPQDERVDPAAVRLERLREYRRRRDRATPLAALLERERMSLGRLKRSLGDAGGAWAQCCPAELAEFATPRACRGGVLTVAVTDAAVRHQVARWLRSGGERRVCAACRSPVRRVRLVLETSGS
jgi:hypothetical protein